MILYHPCNLKVRYPVLLEGGVLNGHNVFKPWPNTRRFYRRGASYLLICASGIHFDIAYTLLLNPF